MTHHKAVDMVRREERRRTEPLESGAEMVDGAPPIEDTAWLGLARDQVRQAMQKLPDPHREVIELAYFAGFSQSELAERLSLPIGTVKSRTFAAMTTLRQLLSESGLNPEHEWNTSTS